MTIDLPAAQSTQDLLDHWLVHLRQTPHKICIIEASSGKTYTWSQLHMLALHHQGKLLDLHLQPYDRVALLGAASAQWIACVWACWSLGVVWTALPPPHAPARLRHILDHAQVHAVWDGQDWRPHQKNAPPCPAPLAYITYTSGSTGAPKAVMVPPTAVSWVWRHQARMFEVDGSSVCCWSLSPAFDASVSDIGVALSSGAQLVIAPTAEFSRWSGWKQMMDAYVVTHIDAPPSWLNLWHKKIPPASLKTIVCGGEPTPRTITDAWAGRVRWINVYGPTEATICTSMEQVMPQSPMSLPTLGQPMEFVQYQIEKTTAHFSPAAQEGQLLIGGPAVALGYWRDPDLTAQKFVEHNGVRWFKSGDCVRHEHEKWYFVGRLDRQIKRNGQLLNLDEVEYVLGQNPSVTQVAVVIDPAHKLVAHCCTPSLLPSLREDLRTWAANHLPTWGVPQRWVFHEQLPTNGNGKVNRQELSHAL